MKTEKILLAGATGYLGQYISSAPKRRIPNPHCGTQQIEALPCPTHTPAIGGSRSRGNAA